MRLIGDATTDSESERIKLHCNVTDYIMLILDIRITSMLFTTPPFRVLFIVP